MTDRTEQLTVLVRLRQRDLDRRTREATEAARTAAIAEQALADAARARDEACARQNRALAKRLTVPADLLVADYCRSCELRVEEATDSLRNAEEALATATVRADAARGRLLRAQARCDVLDQVLRRARLKQRQASDRRAADEGAERHAGNGWALAWA